MTHPAIPLKTYTIIFVNLMILLAITMAASFIPYDRYDLSALGLSLALAIAVAKGALVVLYFMHLKISSPLTRLFAIAGVLWLTILLTLTYNDYLTRGWMPVERGWSQKAMVPKP